MSALRLDGISVGICDVILPGDKKALMNKVTEAKKAAEANLIARREETAATLYFAGEATQEALNRTVASAIASGYRAADALVEWTASKPP